MNIILSLVFTFIFSHPLENGSANIIDFSGVNPNVYKGNSYISPIDGFIDEITLFKNKYTVKISNDNLEFVFTDLDSVNKKKGEKIKIGDEIGICNNITRFTKFALIRYNNVNEFPQFINNKIQFNGNGFGTPIYSMESGTVRYMNYDYSLRGNIIEITGSRETENNIQYWHLMGIAVTREVTTVNAGTTIGYMGSTGISLDPNLTVFFADTYFDIKAVYIKAK